MKHNRIRLSYVLIGVLVVIIFISLYLLSQINNLEVKKETVYMVVKTTVDVPDFWKNVENGAKVAAVELGVNVYVVGPERETDIAKQIEIMEELIKKKPTAIVIAGADYILLGEVCQKAVDAGITVVTYDSDVKFATPHSSISTNNLDAAQRLGHEVSTNIREEAQVGIISHVKGASTAIDRENGFLKGIKPASNLTLAGDILYCDNDKEKAMLITKELIAKYPKMKVIFGTNEVALAGISLAVGELGVKGSYMVVGFDISKLLVQQIEVGNVNTIMVQRPFNMGYLAIKEALEVSKGKGVEQIDTGSIMINKETLFLPQNQKFIVPTIEP